MSLVQPTGLSEPENEGLLHPGEASLGYYLACSDFSPSGSGLEN
jgi:hypothetical protein